MRGYDVAVLVRVTGTEARVFEARGRTFEELVMRMAGQPIPRDGDWQRQVAQRARDLVAQDVRRGEMGDI